MEGASSLGEQALYFFFDMQDVLAVMSGNIKAEETVAGDTLSNRRDECDI